MITLNNTQTYGWEAAVRGMRNPLNSWAKSDSAYDGEGNYIVGVNDLDLMKRLRNAGSDHRKYLRMISVSVDIDAPLYWWKEYDTYKVGTVANSCSTMHKIHAKEFTLDDFSHEHMTGSSLKVLENTIEALNENREWYLRYDSMSDKAREGFESGIDSKKDLWWQLIQLLPSSYNQLRTVTLNYEVITNMYHARKNHKLDEWSVGFCKWVETLPLASELIING